MDEPKFHKGDRVYVGPVKMEATVIRQYKHYDGSDESWVDVELEYDDGEKGRVPAEQVKKIRPCTCHPDDNPPVPCARQYAITECRQEREMNERIKDLALKAGAGEWGDSVIPAMMNIEKFAELIVRECANINYNSPFQDGEFHAREVLEHFGVE